MGTRKVERGSGRQNTVSCRGLFEQDRQGFQKSGQEHGRVGESQGWQMPIDAPLKKENAGRSPRFNVVQSKLLVNGSTTISE